MEQNVKTYDFKKPQRYSTDNMRFLSVISEDYCKNTNLFLAYELKRPNITCKVEKVEQTNYEEFINSISPKSVIVEHAIQPLVKDLIYQIDKSVALTYIDLMLGGDGVFENYERDLTEIDKQLIFHLCTKLLTRLYIVETCKSREVLRVHSNAGASKKYPVSESVLIAHMKMMYGDKEIGKMRFCNPYSCMEPILDQLETKILFRNKNIEYDFEFTNAIYNNVCGANVDIVARLGETNISVEDLLNLQVGDILSLDTKVAGDLDLYVAGAKAFKCKPGLIKNKKGVIITNSIRKEG
ncbi:MULTISPECIES: flagellar motor switch protein FliM [Romboutsia]|uniref:Flagellar motor switch protein FliM n=1 Tax=Romboutsia hominis TaxID=1507512 RepID=A0A2P2BPI0_9FIRM|nr:MULTISPECIES: FliM/FliN family flagellar motor switch protein [Romboutsia]MCH1959598.1 FliM/FliN family flagellar motor switch protein [Romboutsia hominis]MCH1969978.1 FliM/FliN family flagellar motor switch protein [Romboutsia hominis]MDB8790834.1 FliM/FliN family flagellar motor switch protein [Romboutsia sp. 1001216sp1]MDB8792372.1 FliM/FliN family flagellar motor switch protein [Romboutsia sp. 1001216sp1]MDB8795667.1 FliM/FliN family flagellar motor switch protein [Romboutsia sp. 100121